MARITDSIKAFAIAVGGPGIFIIAFLDSSFLSFPEVNDLLIVLMVVEHPHLMIYYASMATLGSVSGCLALYFVARKGGHPLIQKRFSGGSVEWGTNLMRKYGVVALLVPSLLPPPAPFKIFVVLAGVAAVPLPSFVAAIAVGRGVRYFGEGILALLWGAQAISYLQDNGSTVSLWLGIATLAAGVAYFGCRALRQTAK
ncbi:MAG: DedA family protein [Acidobacteria bacterium]|nr:DedA family protein [Acidobacteriota bacterium]